MKRLFIFLLVASLILNACTMATGITISKAWARPAANGDNGAVYFLLQNHSAGKDELVSVSSDVAEAAEMHLSSMEGDVMQMAQVDSLPIKGKASIQFEPGGLHVMLVGLKQELKVGDEIQITLHFKEHEDITVKVSIQENGDIDTMPNH
jgi:periplasmic copper chaperone A